MSKTFPLYVGGCVALQVCVCVCGSLLLLFCVKYCPAQAASAAASHRIMCHTLWPGGHIMRHPICMGCHSLSPLSLSLSHWSLFVPSVICHIQVHCAMPIILNGNCNCSRPGLLQCVCLFVAVVGVVGVNDALLMVLRKRLSSRP